jgi:CubicO group peptidase (beta-lactamase class C family)
MRLSCLRGALGALLLVGALLVPAFLAPAADAPPSSKEIAAALQPFVESGSIAGAVTLVADKDRILALDAVGYADLGAKKPMHTNSLFWIASESKPITAAAFMILVDEGKVSLDDPVEKYIPEFKNVKLKSGEKPEKAPTIRHILSHTSGLPFSSAKEKPTLDRLTLEEGVKSYAETPLNTEPGTKYAYSNAGINTAGRIIEILSGMPYEDFLDKRLFGPLGMKDTTFWPNKEQLDRLAKSYKSNKEKTAEVETPIGQLWYPLDNRKRQPMPAGGLFSTATDMSRFGQMMLNNGTFNGKKILSPEAVAQLTKKQTGELKESYGLGFSVGGDSFGHGGAHATNLTIDRKTGLIRVWMVQQNGAWPGNGDKAQGTFNNIANKLFAHADK